MKDWTSILNPVQKVAINCNYGGFALTTEILARVHELQNKFEVDNFDRTNAFYMSEFHNRTNPALVQAILEAQLKGTNGSLKVVEVPAGVKFIIDDRDGWETVEEEHRIFNKWATL